MRASSDVLVVNADDFGLTRGVSEGILRAHDDGIVTSTSILPVARSFDAAMASLAGSTLGVGVHLSLVGEDPPLLDRREVPSLYARTGFRRSWREFAAATLTGRVDPEDVRRELTAQIERVCSGGIRPTHLDAHQHLHLLPSVGTVALDLARTFDIPAIRVPRSTSGARGFVVRRLASRLASDVARRSMATTDRFAGLEESGHMTESRLLSVVDALAIAGGSAEIGVHPGVEHDPDRSRFDWGFEWGAELDALCAASTRERVRAAGFRLGTFADLPDAASRRRGG